MIDSIVESFRGWVVSSRRYRTALKSTRAMWRVLAKNNGEHYEEMAGLLVSEKVANEATDLVRRESQALVEEAESRANDLARGLSDDRKHYKDELKDRDGRIERLESDLAIRTSERDQQILINERDKARVEAETAKFVAEKVRHLTDQNRQPDEGIL